MEKVYYWMNYWSVYEDVSFSRLIVVLLWVISVCPVAITPSPLLYKIVFKRIGSSIKPWSAPEIFVAFSKPKAERTETDTASPRTRSDGHRSRSREAVLVQEALAVVPPPQRQPQCPAPAPRVRPLRPQRRRRDHPRRDGGRARHARPRRRPRQPGGHRRRLHPGWRRRPRLRGLRGPPPRSRRRALRSHRRGGARQGGRGRGRGHEGGVPGLRRERRRVHLGVRAAGRAQEAGPGGGAEPGGGAGDDLQRRPRPRRPSRLRRVQVHDAGDHRVGSLTAARPASSFGPPFCFSYSKHPRTGTRNNHKIRRSLQALKVEVSL